MRLTNEYKKRTMARAVPGAHWDGRWHIRAWVVDDPTPKSAAVILKLFPETATIHPELLDLRETLLLDARPFDNATDYGRRVNSPAVQSRLEAEGYEFYNYQAVDLGYLADVLRIHRGGYIAWERGLGKTLAACAIAEDLGAKRILVVAPNTAKLSVWVPELKRFIPNVGIRVMPNDKKQRARVMEDVANDNFRDDTLREPDVKVLVAHYESLALVAKERKDWKGWARYGEWDLIVVDEAHRLANPKTQLHRAIRHIPTRFKLALSGSMIQNKPEEIYGVLHWLFPDHYSSQWRDWNNRYLEYVDSGYGKVLIGPKPSMVKKMRAELGVFTVYRRKDDELDLPRKTNQTLLVELNPGQRRAYDSLRDEFVARLDSGESIIAIKPIVMLTRLRQIASGLDLLSDSIVDSSKLDLAVQIIEDDPDAAYVVFSWYKAAAYALAERLRERGEHVYVVTGDTPQRQRAAAIQEFQAGGQGRIFVGTISTLGESVNLHRATNAIFLDRSWNPAANAQAEDRLYRIGQDRPVTITHIVARDTVDELRVLPTLTEKESLRRMILGGI